METDGSTGSASPSKLPTVTCYVCGCESPLVEFFRKTRKGMLCPRCLPQAMSRIEIRSYGWLLVSGLVFVVVGSHQFSLSFGMLLLNLVLYFALVLPVICGHEAIHGLAAWLAGGRVFELALGGGTLRRSFRWRGTRYALRRGVFMGFCLAAFPHRCYLRVRWLLFVTAPLLAQILLIVWLLPHFDWMHFVSQVALAEIVVVLNVIVVAANLWPRKLNALLATDGYWILELLRGRRKLDELHAFYYILVSHFAYEYENYPAMSSAAEAGLAIYPENSQLKNNLAVALLMQDCYAEALALFEEFLAAEKADAPSVSRGLFLCNRAIALFYLALEPEGISPEQMAAAHASAGEAFYLLPWVDGTVTVRAVDAYFQGQHQEALVFLEQILHCKPQASYRAGVLGFKALACYRLQQQDAALAALAEAWRIYPQGDRALARISAIIGGDG